MKLLFTRFILVALLGCAACTQKPAFNNTDLTGAPNDKLIPALQLTDHNGTVRKLADYQGKLLVIFFGFTHCPDVCPTTLYEMDKVMKALGEQAKDVQVAFVTVDPERDTPALLKQYVPAFNPTFVGLYGDAAATKQAAQAFNVFYEKVPGKTPTSYTINHTAASYVLDKQGHLRLFVRHGKPESVEHLVSDLRQLL